MINNLRIAAVFCVTTGSLSLVSMREYTEKDKNGN